MSKLISVEDCPFDSVIQEEIYAEGSMLPLVVEGAIFNKKIKEKLLDNSIFEIQVRLPDEEDVEVEGIYISEEPKLSESKGLTFDDFISRYKNHIELLDAFYSNIPNSPNIGVHSFSFMVDYYIKNQDNLGAIIKYIAKNPKASTSPHVHAINVAIYSLFIGRLFEISTEDIKTILIGSFLHDLGKSIDGTSQEEHTIVGYSYIKDNNSYNTGIKDIVLLHHECEGGSGFPKGISSKKIPFLVKIVSIADRYDHLILEFTEDPSKSHFSVFQELLSLAFDGKIDAEITHRFIRVISELYVGSKIKFTNGKEGAIEFIHPKQVRYPLVRVSGKIVDTSRNTTYKNFKFI